MTNRNSNKAKAESRATAIVRGYCGRKDRARLAKMMGMSRGTLLSRINHPDDIKLSEVVMLMCTVGLEDNDLLDIVHDLKKRALGGGSYGR